MDAAEEEVFSWVDWLEEFLLFWFLDCSWAWEDVLDGSCRKLGKPRGILGGWMDWWIDGLMKNELGVIDVELRALEQVKKLEVELEVQVENG